MARKTGRKKPEAVGRVVDEQTQQYIDVYLDRNILDFYFEFLGEEYRDPDATVLKLKAADMLKNSRELNWIPIIEIGMDHPVEQKPSDKETDGQKAKCDFKVRRFYLAVTPLKKVKSSDWDTDRNWEEWVNNPIHLRSRFSDEPEEDAKPKETLDAYRIRCARDYNVREGMLVKGELVLPFYFYPESAYWNRNEKKQPTIYLPYSEEMWNGLMQMLEAVRSIASKLDDLVTTPEKLKMVSQLGSGMVTLALPTPKVHWMELDVLRDLLSLVEVDVTEEWLSERSVAEQKELSEWAAAVHVRASDNNGVKVPPRPNFLPQVIN